VFSDFKNKGYRLSDNIINNVGRETISKRYAFQERLKQRQKRGFFKENDFSSIPPRRRGLESGMRLRDKGTVSGRVEGRRPVFKVSLNNGELGQCPHSNTMFFNSRANTSRCSIRRCPTALRINGETRII
jgi:hypothetical protein